MSKLVFEKKSTSGSMATGTLSWGGKKYSARSGGFGKGQLPNGKYTVRVRSVVDTGLAAGFRTGSTQFFIPIRPSFTTTRSGFGIHPDGNKTGTLGCLGLPATDAAKFWKDWMGVKLSARPTSLLVKHAPAKEYKILSAVKDRTVRQALRKSLKGDGRLSTAEVKYILRSALDGNKVTKRELADLQAILKGSRSLSTESRQLIQKFIVNPKSVSL